MAKDSGRNRAASRRTTEAEGAEDASGAGSTAYDPEGAEPAAGWSQQPADRYASGDSGGWGGPDRTQTGPLPRLGRSSAPEHTPDEQVTYAEADDLEQGRHNDHVVFDDGETGEWGHPPRASAGSLSSGLGALFDLSFRRSATGAIAPFTYVVLLVFLLLDYMRSIYDYSSAAGAIGPGALGGLVILFVVGLFKIVVLAALARLALELCQHVAQIAASRRSDDETW